MTAVDTTASEVAWDIEPLLAGRTIDELLDDAEHRATELTVYRGKIAEFSAADLAGFMDALAGVVELLERASSYAHLAFATDTADPARGAPSYCRA